MRHSAGFRRTAGTILPQDLVRNRFKEPPDTDIEADIAAIDAGEGRTAFCYFRGSYGHYPRRFSGCMMDMKGSTLELRPLLVFQQIRRKRIVIAEQLSGAHVREFEGVREALQLAHTGQFSADGRLAFAGNVVISCLTAEGVLEFAVRRPDVKLVLHFFERLDRG